MKRLMVIGALAVVAAACGSDGGAAATTAPPLITTAAVDTTASATTSSTSSTTTSTSTSTTTTVPPTTTTVPTETLIKQAVQDYIAAYFSCGQSPAECNPSTFTASQGPSRTTVSRLIDGMKTQGLYFSTDLRGSYVVDESVSQPSETQATAVYCAYDGLIVLGPNGPDGLPTVVNDAISSSRYTYRLFLESGVWQVGEQEQREHLGEGSLCPAA